MDFKIENKRGRMKELKRLKRKILKMTKNRQKQMKALHLALRLQNAQPKK